MKWTRKEGFQPETMMEILQNLTEDEKEKIRQTMYTDPTDLIATSPVWPEAETQEPDSMHLTDIQIAELANKAYGMADAVADGKFQPPDPDSENQRLTLISAMFPAIYHTLLTRELWERRQQIEMCQGITRRGKPCRMEASKNGFCIYHQRQAEDEHGHYPDPF